MASLDLPKETATFIPSSRGLCQSQERPLAPLRRPLPEYKQIKRQQ